MTETSGGVADCRTRLEPGRSTVEYLTAATAADARGADSQKQHPLMDPITTCDNF